ncbi:MAG: nucleotidyl transferase AbiEii/AbiGii toxin family protein [Gammaproteobacteria bacterium]
MHEVISAMLVKYDCQNHQDYQNALKEIIHEIALLGLWRSKFFEKAAFYGGTALRILYGLDRFSEDLDFSLLKPDKKFQLNHYFSFLEAEISSFGFKVSINDKIKNKEAAIQSAFIKAGTKQHFLEIQAPNYIVDRIHCDDLLRIKIEIDVNPPSGFNTEVKPLLQPIPFMVNTYQAPDLFAGKCHAILCRPWQNRVKGRDWYDLVWYVSRNIPIHLAHLKKRLEQTAAWNPDEQIVPADVVNLLTKKIDTVDFTSAKKEVMPFLKDIDSVEIWSQSFFSEIVSRIKFV